jgi:hypothetical protein
MDTETLVNWLKLAGFNDILKENESAKKLKNQVAYNLFTISSTTSHLENFHSDVIASLLNPQELHECGDIFLHIFIDHVSKIGKNKVNKEDFKNTVVSRETGRLDIWIRDSDSKKSIIIENKINNAVDQESQIDRYFEYAQDKGFQTVAVVYLSLDGSKVAPSSKEHSEDIILNVAAFNTNEDDLVNGWLEKCLQQDINANTSAVINQYIKLLKHLASRTMDRQTLKLFYEKINSDSDVKALADIIEIRNQIPTYRADKFGDEIKLKAFAKRGRYKDNYWLFEDYNAEGNNLKLDVWFNIDGTASLEFWNTSVQNEKGRNILTKVLHEIDMLDQFDQDYWGYAGNGYRKNFQFGTGFTSMTEIDDAISGFVNRFLEALSVRLVQSYRNSTDQA